MAVYQGARRRSPFALDGLLGPLARPRPEAATRRRTHGRRTASARRTADLATVARGGRVATLGSVALPLRVGLRRPVAPNVGLILAAIIVLFCGGFLWLSQSVRVSATNYDVVRLISERDRLEALRVDLRSDLERLSGEPAVRKQALDHGLGQLAAPIVIPAR